MTAPCLYWELSKAAFELFWFCAKAWGQEVLMMTPIKYLSYAIALQERCSATWTCITRLCGACTWRGGQGLQRRRQPRRFCVSQVKSEYFNFLEVIDILQKLFVGAEERRNVYYIFWVMQIGLIILCRRVQVARGRSSGDGQRWEQNYLAWDGEIFFVEAGWQLLSHLIHCVLPGQLQGVWAGWLLLLLLKMRRWKDTKTGLK